MKPKTGDSELPTWFSDKRFKKADLHCHSVYSTFKYFRLANTRDSYNRPEEVYRVAKERGMDFITLTDHDDGTRVSYAADMQVGGLIASVGQRMLGGVAKMMADKFFNRMGELLSA